MITELAPAKINLALHVRARRTDGYHELETLFAFVRDGDTVTLAPGPLSLAITGPFATGLTGEGDNLILRAARAFAAGFDLPEIGTFTLDKHLPVASGIGGGSADAAAALRALAKANGVPLDDPRLFEIAAALGSDIPACLLGRTALGEGRGERLYPLDGPTGMPVLLVNPGVAVSTAAVFKAWDGIDKGPMPDGDALSLALAGRNDLEAPGAPPRAGDRPGADAARGRRADPRAHVWFRRDLLRAIRKRGRPRRRRRADPRRAPPLVVSRNATRVTLLRFVPGHCPRTMTREWRKTATGPYLALFTRNESPAPGGALVDGPRSPRAPSKLRDGGGNFAVPTLHALATDLRRIVDWRHRLSP